MAPRYDPPPDGVWWRGRLSGVVTGCEDTCLAAAPQLPASTPVPGDLPRSARARYLRIAMELATRQQGGRREVPYLAARVQLADVAAAVGRTRTSLYRQWETQ